MVVFYWVLAELKGFISIFVLVWAAVQSVHTDIA